MSRLGATKTRGADKTKPPAAQTPVITHEIVPGKFNDNDWNSMVDKDASDEFVHEIMDELMESTMTAIYQKYIERQLLPFTITQAREAMVEIIEWRFLTNDEGEKAVETDLGWTEDEEPEPGVTDCWAQGSVPKALVEKPATPFEAIPEEVDEQKPTAEADTGEQEEVSQEPAELADIVSDTEEGPDDNAKAAEKKDNALKESSSKGSHASLKKQSRSKFKPYRGKIKSAGVSKMTESLEETEMQMIYNELAASMPPSDDKPSTLLNMPASCTSILKVQTGRPPGTKDVVYDDLGNVIAVMKLDPEKLPSHKITVKYHVVDPAVEAAQARLDAMRKGKSTGSKKKTRSTIKYASSESLTAKEVPKTRQQQPSANVAPLPPPLASETSKFSDKSVGASPNRVTRRGSSSRADHGRTKTLPSMRKPSNKIEEMEVSHGVIVREGGRVKKGPGRYYGKFDVLEESQKGMRPIALRVANPDITVEDLLDRHTPILRPLGEASPLPPIVPHPPAQQPQQV